MDYKLKYLKYKSKYLNLKQQLAGESKLVFNNIKVGKKDDKTKVNIISGQYKDKTGTIISKRQIPSMYSSIPSIGVYIVKFDGDVYNSKGNLVTQSEFLETELNLI